MSVPSQSQSPPIIHFTNSVRQCSSPSNPMIISPSISIDDDSQKQFEALISRPQSTPISSPILLTRLSSYYQQTNENCFTMINNNNKRRLTTANYSSLTNVTPLNEINNKIKSSILYEILDDDDNNNEDRYRLRPPPLMVLSQSIKAKHPEQLIDIKLNNRFSSIKDLPDVPANYSFVLHGFTQTQKEAAKRLTRHMGDCFTNETIDITTTHIILPNDDPNMPISLDIILGFIYGCHIATFEWLKSSSSIGEWLHVKKFQPKELLKFHEPLNNYRKARQQQKQIKIFHECGFIYLTSIVPDRSLLLKLITLLGGNITINRNRAQIIVGQSSKALQIIIHPQVTERWVVDSIKSGKCHNVDDYLIENNNQF